jgi:hypothetical protein
MPSSRIIKRVLLGLAIPLISACSGFPAPGAVVPAVVPQESEEAAKLRELLPGAEVFSSDQLRENFTRLELTPHGRQDLRFEMLAPRGWDAQVSEIEPDQLTRDAEQPVPLAELFPPDEDASLRISYTRQARDLTPQKYLEQVVAERKWTLLGRQSTEIHGQKAELALTRNEHPEFGPVLRRVTIIRHEEFLFMVAGAAVEPSFERFKRLLGVSVTSLQVLGR